jgi:RNA polymerase sigma-70 factor (ECF subfamily)
MFKNYSKYSDIELVEIIKRNGSDKDKAFAEFYNRHSDNVFTYCLKLLVSYQDAKDAYQETFIKFYETINHIEPYGSMTSLLYKIARNVTLNIISKRKKFVDIKEEEFEYNYVMETESKEIIELIGQALELIPYYQRELFVLKYYQGLSYDEIAQITLLDKGTLRNRMQRTLSNLQKILRPYFNEQFKIEKKGK